MNEDKLMPIHPGEVLLEEFIKPMNLSQNQIALALGVPEQCIIYQTNLAAIPLDNHEYLLYHVKS